MKTFVVGDIHGRCAQLLNLLDMLPRDPSSDTLVFLGDLIDRGEPCPGAPGADRQHDDDRRAQRGDDRFQEGIDRDPIQHGASRWARVSWRRFGRANRAAEWEAV